MKKMKFASVALSLVFLLAFNAIFFVVGGTDHPASVWMAYGMIHFAYLFFLATPLFVMRGKTAYELGSSLSTITFGHFVLEFLVSLIVCLVAPEGYKFTLVMYVILLAAFFAVFFVTLFANAHTEEQAKRQAVEVGYIKTAASRVKILMGKLNDTAANRQIERAYDALHASQTRSNAVVASLEAMIVAKVGELESAVSAEDAEKSAGLAKELLALVEERTRQLQLYN